MLITVVADYGTGDLAFAEVRQTFAELLPEAGIAALSVNAARLFGFPPSGTPVEIIG